MGYKYFRINCIVRIIVLAITFYVFIHLIYNTGLYATSLMVGILIVVQVAALIRYVEKTNRDLSRFLTSIKFGDFSQSFSAGQKGTSFADLHDAFAGVVAEFRRARTEREEQYRYLQTVVQHIGLGIIAFDRSGEIDLINNAAKRLLQVPHLKNVNDLAALSPKLTETFMRSRARDKSLVKIEIDGETVTLAVYATEFTLRDRSFTLVSMQNIESELAEQEMAAWQKLIRVLTHEIMNSVTPIASLAATVNGMIGNSHSGDRETPLTAESRDDIRDAVATIEKRSQGLLHFIDAYRNLTRVPKPDFQIFPVSELFGRVTQLMKEQVESAGITLHATVEPQSLELTADPELIEQVLINLILNSVQALNHTPNAKIELTSRLDDRGRVLIGVEDNGPGIDDDLKEKIFTPFFTTRKEGSGIGLSLSRQIMRLHKGAILVQSTPGEFTRFTLRF